MIHEVDTNVAANLWVSRYKWRNGLIQASVLVLFSIFFWVFFAQALVKNAASEAVGWGIFALIADSAALVVLWVGIFRWGHPATSLRIDSDGIIVHYPKKSRALKWADRGFELTIRRMNHYQEEGSQYTSTQWSVIESRWSSWPRIVLRPDQEAVLVEAASHAGMDVQQVKDPTSDSGESVRIVAGRASLVHTAGV